MKPSRRFFSSSEVGSANYPSMKKHVQVKKNTGVVVLIALVSISAMTGTKATEMRVPCMDMVRKEGGVIAAARAYLSGIGKAAPNLTALRVEDLVRGGHYSLVLAGELGEPVIEAIVLYEAAPARRNHGRFVEPVRYLAPAAAVAASGFEPGTVDACRLVRVAASPWNGYFRPLWEIRAAGFSRFIDQSGERIDRSIESLIHRDRGGGGNENERAGE